MPVVVVAVLTAAVLALSACGLSGNESSGTSLPAADLQRALQALTARGADGAVALVTTEAETWHGASGYADRRTKRRANVTDRFSIGSTTKTFVAAVVLQLVGEGRLSLQDRVEKWLPAVLREGKRITIRQLLNHTSGLSDESSFDATLASV